ncbi:MAG TPA: hypothetical protein DD795_08825 [Erythrobacter sp.]|nr:hypothetical protein [Sphingomonadaceae bacterium]HBQ92859.1 hypothetical protein [Erythrobacter sp.]
MIILGCIGPPIFYWRLAEQTRGAVQIAYYQLEGTAVIIDTRHSLPWCWRDGQWTKAPDLLDVCAATGTELARADFFRRFPRAALQISTLPLSD